MFAASEEAAVDRSHEHVCVTCFRNSAAMTGKDTRTSAMARPPPDFTASRVLQDGSLANFVDGLLQGLHVYPDGTRVCYAIRSLHSNIGLR
jgi:hypothetical protein